MKKPAGICLLCLLLVFLAGCGQQEKTATPAIGDVVQEKQDAYSCVFDGVKRDFLLELPAETEGAPLVLMLPGYGNTAESFHLQTRFEQDACPRGYAVAYVTGLPNPNVPTSANGWNSNVDPEGNRDVEFLAALADWLQNAYALDKSRTYAVGFSNGAFMTHRLAMDAQDTFTAVVSVAGLMPESVWEERRQDNSVGFFQITGEKDETVPKNSDGSARYSRAPAIEDVMDYWADSNGLKLSETELIGDASVLTKYKSAERQPQVWHLVVSDGHHSWPNEQYNQIDTNALILEFLDSQKS